MTTWTIQVVCSKLMVCPSAILSHLIQVLNPPKLLTDTSKFRFFNWVKEKPERTFLFL